MSPSRGLFGGWMPVRLPDGSVEMRQAPLMLKEPWRSQYVGMRPEPNTQGFPYTEGTIHGTPPASAAPGYGLLRPDARQGGLDTAPRASAPRAPGLEPSKAVKATVLPKVGGRTPESDIKWWDGAQLPGNVDWEFLNKREGFKTVAKVPSRRDGTPIGQSGLTLGAGVDLGWQSESGLRAMGVGDEMIGRLKPYLGLRLAKAQAVAKENPLNLTAEDAAELTRSVAAHGYNEIARRYNASAQGDLRFETLPREMQTVILSVAHQYGSDLAKRTPSFWSQVTKGQWQDAHDNLLNFNDAYGPRRQDEAKQLAKALEGQRDGRQISEVR